MTNSQLARRAARDPVTPPPAPPLPPPLPDTPYGQLQAVAAGIAHDLNNLLTVAAGCQELLLTRLPATDPGRRLATDAATALARAGDLTRRLLAVARSGPPPAAPLDLRPLLPDLRRLLGRVAGGRVAVDLTAAPDLWPVRLAPGQFERAAVNLVANARDALPGGGAVGVRLDNVALAGGLARDGGEVRAGGYVRLSVADAGCGMPPAVLARLFEPYFTTKGAGRGTGLGLASLYADVRAAGGHVAVDSVAGAGTTVKVFLPRADEAAG